MDQIERRHIDLARDLGLDIERRTRTSFHRPAPQRRRHPPDRRGQRAPARARDGERRVDGDAPRRGVPARTKASTCSGSMRARCCMRRSGPTRPSARTIFRRPATSNPISSSSSGWPRAARCCITQGFIASDASGDTVLLGRGGSDTSGSYFAAKLGARRLEIWTDVPGMFTSNPRSVPTARLLQSLDYDEAQEIASSGAKVLHPRCILPVKQYGIPLYVHATQTPELKGTVVTPTGGDGGARVKAVCIKKGITLLVDGNARHVAPGRLPRRCVRGVQGARPVGRPGVDVGDQRHGVARSGRQHARRPRARCAA